MAKKAKARAKRAPRRDSATGATVKEIFIDHDEPLLVVVMGAVLAHNGASVKGDEAPAMEVRGVVDGRSCSWRVHGVRIGPGARVVARQGSLRPGPESLGTDVILEVWGGEMTDPSGEISWTQPNADDAEWDEAPLSDDAREEG